MWYIFIIFLLSKNKVKLILGTGALMHFLKLHPLIKTQPLTYYYFTEKYKFGLESYR
jgi:hypothetical protein